ncbi:hypothetical protein D3C77_550470 [compost metagenome]
MLAAAFHIAGADVGIVAFQGRNQIVEGQFIGGQTLGVRCNQVLVGIAADGVDLGHTRHVAQLRLDDPILDYAQVRGCVGRAIFLDRAFLGFDGP